MILSMKNAHIHKLIQAVQNKEYAQAREALQRAITQKFIARVRKEAQK